MNNEKYQSHIQECARNLKLIIPSEIITHDENSYRTEEYLEFLQAFYLEVKKQNNIKISFWSINSILDFNQIPYKDLNKIFYNSADELMVNFENKPTWFEIWKKCEFLIENSDDTTNVYIEDMDVMDNEAIFFVNSIPNGIPDYHQIQK